LSLIQLVTPTTPRERAVRIAAASSGFLYYVSVTGITGERQSLPSELVDQVGWLRERTDLPVCVGFGVSQPQHAAQLRNVADGVIVGSAIVRHLARLGQEDNQVVLSELLSLVDQLLAALQAD
jgi:tryptophan synthase alpha chain